MGWSLGWDNNWNRDVGYGVPAQCDQPRCKALIDRGLGYVCGNQPYGGEGGCGLYFCGKHQRDFAQRCERCVNGEEPFKPKPDVKEWIDFKMKDASWKKWRESQGIK